MKQWQPGACGVLVGLNSFILIGDDASLPETDQAPMLFPRHSAHDKTITDRIGQQQPRRGDVEGNQVNLGLAVDFIGRTGRDGWWLHVSVAGSPVDRPSLSSCAPHPWPDRRDLIKPACSWRA